MKLSISNCLMMLCAVGVLGCAKRGEVGEEMQDLKEAQERSPEVAQQLRQDIELKKQELVQLEEKLARAELGVTDEVLEQRKELKEAVQRNQDQVTAEVKEAQQAVEQHEAQAQRAQSRLDATRVPDTSAGVTPETAVHATSSDAAVRSDPRPIKVDTEKAVERADPSGVSAQKP